MSDETNNIPGPAEENVQPKETQQEAASAPAPAPAPAPSSEPRRYDGGQRYSGGDHARRPRHDGEGHDSRGEGGRFPKFRRKGCRFCRDGETIDYKKMNTLDRFVTDGGKILPRRVTGTCAKHQRVVAKAIKRARTLALLPFIEK